MWGLGTDLSSRAAQKLAADGHRLLLVGQDRQMLEELDARLAQSELHRLTATTTVTELDDWVHQQNVGLDGLILFPPPPEPAPSLFVPLSFNLRSSERSMLSALELLRGLLPQLRRGKRPKRILIVLDWSSHADSGPLAALLEGAWEAAMPLITRELNTEGSDFSALCLHERTEPQPATEVSAAHSEPSTVESSVEQHLAQVDQPPASEYVESVLSLIGLYFSPVLRFMNGQFLHHPSAGASNRPVSAVRQ